MWGGGTAPDRTGLPSGTAKADGEARGQAVWLSHARIDCTSQAGSSGELSSRGVPGTSPSSSDPQVYCTQLLAHTRSRQLRDSRSSHEDTGLIRTGWGISLLNTTAELAGRRRESRSSTTRRKTIKQTKVTMKTMHPF